MKKEMDLSFRKALVESFASTELQECYLAGKDFKLDRYNKKSDREIIKKHKEAQTLKAKAENSIKK